MEVRPIDANRLKKFLDRMEVHLIERGESKKLVDLVRSINKIIDIYPTLTLEENANADQEIG